jgi:hypothetical protein
LNRDSVSEWTASVWCGFLFCCSVKYYQFTQLFNLFCSNLHYFCKND